MNVVMIGIGGLFGAVFRYWMTQWLPVPLFWQILAINGLGSALIGVLPSHQPIAWALLAIGFCGAFTTFSAYSLNIIELMDAGQWPSIALGTLAMNIGCIGMCWLGRLIRQWLF